MRIVVIVGARPNFIKVGPLMPALAAAGIDARLAHTGQHYDALMSDVFFNDLSIPEPAWFLGVGSGTHAVQTGSAMVKLEELFSAEQPDAVMVVGDVNSTLAGALAASPFPVLFPVHPRTRPLLASVGLGEPGSPVRLTDPVGYLDMLALQRAAAAIVTDSGGVQEEACMLGTPCVTVRRNTEREITVRVGANRLASAETPAISAALDEALASDRSWTVPERWDLEVAERVVAALDAGVLPLIGC